MSQIAFHTNPDIKSSECTYRYDYSFFSNKYLTFDHTHLLNPAHDTLIFAEYSDKMEPNIRKCKTRGLDSPIVNILRPYNARNFFAYVVSILRVCCEYSSREL